MLGGWDNLKFRLSEYLWQQFTTFQQHRLNRFYQTSVFEAFHCWTPCREKNMNGIPTSGERKNTTGKLSQAITNSHLFIFKLSRLSSETALYGYYSLTLSTFPLHNFDTFPLHNCTFSPPCLTLLPLKKWTIYPPFFLFFSGIIFYQSSLSSVGVRSSN